MNKIDKADRLKKDTDLLKHAKYQDQVREMIKFLGSDPDIVLKEDNDKNISIVMEAQRLVDSTFNSDLFQLDLSGKYSVLAKITAVSVLTASLAVKTDLGLPSEPTPYYTAVSHWLDVPEESLRRWWKGKDLIQREIATLAYGSIMRSAFKQVQLIENITDVLMDNANLKEMVKTPAGFGAVAGMLPKLMFLMKGLHAESKKLKPLTGEDNEVEFVPKPRNIDLVQPIPISAPKEDNNGSSTNKEQKTS